MNNEKEINIDNYEDYIIKPDDPRYKSLDKILSYNLEDLCKGEDRFTRWFIIPELVIKDYVTSHVSVTSNASYNVDWDENWVSKLNIAKVLLECTGLTVQEYFDLTELKINLRSNRPKCEVCGEYLRPTNRLSSGYIGFFGEHKFCSHGCTAHYYNVYEGNAFCSTGVDNRFLALSQAKAVLNRSYTQLEDYDELYIYLIRYDDYFKIGISHYIDRVHDDRLYDPNREIQIWKSDKSTIIELEYDIKTSNVDSLYYLQDSNPPYGWTEIFKLNIIDSILIKLNTLEKIYE